MNQKDMITPFLLITEKEAKTIGDHLPAKKELSYLSDFFKVFGDFTRLKILFVLGEKELCVGDLAALMDMTPSAVSHQLKVLKNSELVRFRREGKTLFYSLADEHVHSITKIGLEHIKE